MSEIADLQQEIFKLTMELHALQRQKHGEPVDNYQFETLEGPVSLRDLFAGKDKLLAIHNMGQGCRYCTLWADGINAFLPHLESKLSVVMLSRDAPEVQRNMANARQWRFRMASHGGEGYITEQGVGPGGGNTPGIVYYELRDDGIYRGNDSEFGPGDLYCSMWNLLAMAGLGEEDWHPQYSYWKRPQKMDDGGANLPD
jgi:predicted dithiol-disulfide oxidoreductase (DUF899 family)